MTKEVLKMALEALKGVLDDTPKVLDASIAGGLYEVVQCRDAITAIKEALAQPERSMKVEGPLHVVCQCDKCKAQPEPVAWEQFYPDIGKPQIAFNAEVIGYVAPQRTWVGLTPTQVKLLWEGVQEEAVKSGDSLNWVFYTHINEALKEKNT